MGRVTLAVCVTGLATASFVACGAFGSDTSAADDKKDGAAPSSSGDATMAGDALSSSSSSSSGTVESPDASVVFVDCAAVTNALFCDDFDEGLVLGAGWDGNKSSIGALNQQTSATPMTSFELVLSSNKGTPGGLVKSFPGPATAGLRIAFDMRPETYASSVFPIAVYFDNDARVLLNIGSAADNGKLEGSINEAKGNAQSIGGFRFDLPSVDAWHHWELSLARDNTVELAIDGSVVLQKTALTNPGGLASGTKLKLLVGLYFAPNPTTWTGHFDDVAITTF